MASPQPQPTRPPRRLTSLSMLTVPVGNDLLTDAQIYVRLLDLTTLQDSTADTLRRCQAYLMDSARTMYDECRKMDTDGSTSNHKLLRNMWLLQTEVHTRMKYVVELQQDYVFIASEQNELKLARKRLAMEIVRAEFGVGHAFRVAKREYDSAEQEHQDAEQADAERASLESVPYGHSPRYALAALGGSAEFTKTEPGSVVSPPQSWARSQPLDFSPVHAAESPPPQAQASTLATSTPPSPPMEDTSPPSSQPRNDDSSEESEDERLLLPVPPPVQPPRRLFSRDHLHEPEYNVTDDSMVE